MTRLVSLLLALGGLFAFGACADRPPEGQRSETRGVASVLSAGSSGSDDGFARALAPRTFVFPADHGPHPEFRTEWWYVTGNLATAEGRPFGFQWTIFRQALASRGAARASKWGARDVYLGHFAVSDVAGRHFRSFERFRRGALGLAGASAVPFKVALDDWVLESGATGESRPTWPASLRATAGEGEERTAIDLILEAGTPPVLQGDRGLSQKSAAPGNASYYYSLPRMSARGEIRIDGTRFAVSGLAWLDREWSTSSLSPAQIGWDWFALQLEDGYELMLYRLRQRDGGASPESRGTLIAPDGSTRAIEWRDLGFTETATWTSPKSGARYPAAWRLRIPGERLDLTIRPLLADQELDGTFRYWEGAVGVTGSREGRPLSGKGYVELTGYAEAAAPPR
ncbi:MAG TPA: lipocalin-like domain-containing protein [Thermoanaerobaculia bacterium]|jgi:predicted secreted hydrolase|nr:lipocalin-like domain-containing protein [Thermoanaerobaculia bacterium]